MSGIYIHIPFCKQACTYCDFYFSISLNQKEKFLDALKNEIISRKDFFEVGEKISTIYFGGGTPSVLNINELNTIFSSLSEVHDLSEVQEITIECNPDDLSFEYLSALRRININRLSLGVQTFSNSYLKFMNRRHDSKKSLESIELIKNAGFSNFSIDIIFGVPGQTKQELLDDLKIVAKFDIPHISIYQLTFEPGTQLYYKLKKGRLGVPSQNDSEEQYNLIIEYLSAQGYEHYEVSNFAKPGMYSNHNSMYWRGKKYLGLGAGAHSYDGLDVRRWNYSNLKKYVNQEAYFEEEHLNETKKYNEIVLTRLRTVWGIELSEIHNTFQKYFLDKVKLLVEKKYAKRSKDNFKLTQTGMLLADKIIEELFFEE
jgi:oxygen-independent coproporphyrinogen-3 oxidase